MRDLPWPALLLLTVCDRDNGGRIGADTKVKLRPKSAACCKPARFLPSVGLLTTAPVSRCVPRFCAAELATLSADTMTASSAGCCNCAVASSPLLLEAPGNTALCLPTAAMPEPSGVSVCPFAIGAGAPSGASSAPLVTVPNARHDSAFMCGPAARAVCGCCCCCCESRSARRPARITSSLPLQPRADEAPSRPEAAMGASNDEEDDDDEGGPRAVSALMYATGCFLVPSPLLLAPFPDCKWMFTTALTPSAVCA